MKMAIMTGDFGGYADPCGSLDMIAETPFKCVDFSMHHGLFGDGWEAYIDAFGDRAAKYGFSLIQAHAGDFYTDGPRSAFHLTELERTLYACQKLGIPQVVVHAQYTPAIPYEDGNPDRMREFNDWNLGLYRQLFPTMEKTGVRVLVENSAEPNVSRWCYYMTGRELRDFLDYVNHPLLGAVWDTGHANMRPNDQHEDIVNLGDRLWGVHIHDNDGSCDEHTAPFTGTTDFDAVMRGLSDSGYKGVFTFECFNFPMRGGSWPYLRRVTSGAPGPLNSASRKIKIEAANLLYSIGEYMLSQYGLFES